LPCYYIDFWFCASGKYEDVREENEKRYHALRILYEEGKRSQDNAFNLRKASDE
jgi:hypothetical protein